MSGFILPNYPTNTKWLTPEEQAYAQWRLIEDTGEADLADATSLKEGVKLAFKDPKLYLFTLLQHVSILSQAFQYFFPSIVKTLGYGTTITLLLTAPVWIATFLVSLVVTYTSSRYNDRSIHIICLMLISVVGNIIAVSTLNTGARFVAVSHFFNILLPATFECRKLLVAALYYLTVADSPTSAALSLTYWRCHIIPDYPRLGCQQLSPSSREAQRVHLFR